MDEVALGQVFFKYFGFSCQSINRGWYNRPVVDVTSGLSLTPSQEIKKKMLKI
jgi:hypothetical protein